MLKERFKDWRDADGAMHEIAIIFGLMPAEWEPAMKRIFWSNIPFSNMLYDILKALVAEGILEENEDQEYRYNVRYVSPWDQPPS